MDVKEINNAAARMFLNQNAANTSTEALGAGFASLLGQTSSALDLLAARNPSDVKDAAAQLAGVERREPVKTSVKENSAAEVSRDDNRKKNVSRPEKENKKAKSASREEETAAVPADVKAPATKTAPAAEAAAPAAAVEAPVASETSQPADEMAVDGSAGPQSFNIAMIEADGKSTGVMEAAFQAQGLVGILTGDGFALTDASLTVEALAALPEVKVLNAEGDVVTMSGAELAAYVQGASDGAELPQLPFLEAVKQVEIPAELVEEAARQAKASAVTPAVAQGVAYDDGEMAAQAALLDEKISGADKLKVEVNVEEEKISYRSPADLIRDRAGVDAVVKAAVAEGEPEAETPVLLQSDGNKPAVVQGQAPAAAQNAQAVQPLHLQAAAFNPVVSADAADAVMTGASGSVSEIAAASGHASAAMAGSENLAALRGTETAKTADTSFRDVYKGMSKEVIEQVKVNITKSAVKGIDKIDISLKPEDLGNIEIKMQISKDGKLQAHIISSRPETMEVLQKEVQNLEKAFNDAGFQTDEGSLSFSFREDGQAGQNNDELRHFIGNVFENEAEQEIAGNDNLQNWNPSRGLNIRV